MTTTFSTTTDRPATLGTYRLVRCIGRDTSGTVYHARTSDGADVTLTTLHPRMANNEAALVRFYQQARLSMRLNHPNLIEGLEIGQDGGVHFFVREFLNAETLHNRLQREGRIDEAEAVRIVSQVARAVGALHQAGVIHRSLTPGNVLVSVDGTVKLAGLRSARLVHDNQEFPRRFPGLQALQFMPPQQIRDEFDEDVRSDVYALGVTLYRMVTGRMPFDGASTRDTLALKYRHEYVSPEEIVPELSRGVVETIRQCLSAAPQRRPQSMGEFLEMLDCRAQPVGEYQLVGPIGRGNSGVVYRGQSADGRQAAIKFLNRDCTDSRRMRFYQEAKLAMKIDHPNVAAVEAVGEHYGRHYMAMEFVPGENLAWKIKKEGRLAESAALRIALEIARGLQQIHIRKLVHRDVKPSNVMIQPDGGVKIVDLGLAKTEQGSLGLTLEGHGLGTPQYMAPEQFCHAKHVDQRADIYSLGVTLYVMLTGEIPFGGETPLDKLNAKATGQYTPVEELVPGINQRTAQLVRMALQPERKRRPATARYFMQAVVACLAAVESSAAEPVAAADPSAASKWHIVFLNPQGRKIRIRARYLEVENGIRSGEIPRAALACFGGEGEFRPIHEIREFRQLFQYSALTFDGNRLAVAPAGAGRTVAHRESANIVRSRGRKLARCIATLRERVLALFGRRATGHALGIRL